MRYGIVSAVSVLVVAVAAQGQPPIQRVDLLSPGDAGWPPPQNVVVADLFVDIDDCDPWTAGGFRGVTQNGATFRFAAADDPNTPQPDFLAGPYRDNGISDPYVTCFSKLRTSRTANNRFNQNVGVAIAGRYSRTGPVAVAAPTEVNLAYFSSPPESCCNPKVDGYNGRIALDVSQVSLPPGLTEFRADLLINAPANAFFLMRSEVAPDQTGEGTVNSSFDYPAITGISWGIWAVPEPASLLMLMLAALAIRVRQ